MLARLSYHVSGVKADLLTVGCLFFVFFLGSTLARGEPKKFNRKDFVIFVLS